MRHLLRSAAAPFSAHRIARGVARDDTVCWPGWQSPHLLRILVQGCAGGVLKVERSAFPDYEDAAEWVVTVSIANVGLEHASRVHGFLDTAVSFPERTH